MAYAIQQDIVDLYGDAFLLRIADRDNSGTVEAEAVTDALEDASAEIDVYIARRYSAEKRAASKWVRRAAIDIGVYILANSYLTLTEDIRQRYEDIRVTLKDIANGKAGIGVTEDDNSEGVVTEGVYKPSSITFATTNRI